MAWRREVISGSVLLLLASGAAAQDRVAIVDVQVPFAPGASVMHVDVPSAQFWGDFQVGSYGGWRYRLFPDGSATFESTGDMTERLDITCLPDRSACQSAARAIEMTEMGGGLASPEAPVTDGRLAPEAVEQAYAAWIKSGKAQPGVDSAAACSGSDKEVRALQDLLRSAGFKPGKSDGKLGRLTLSAIAAAMASTEAAVAPLQASIKSLCPQFDAAPAAAALAG